MTTSELVHFLIAFARTRWGLRFRDRAALDRWQQKRLRRFIQTTLKETGFYKNIVAKDVASLPIVDKAVTLAQFAGFNSHGISLDIATCAAIALESGLPIPIDFDLTLTAGLSSGTQGPRGVFLASAKERVTWAGILLARALDRGLLRDVLFRKEPVRVAFFLRANSALYMTLKSRRVNFRFFDLKVGPEAYAASLSLFQPEVLVAPASILAWLAGQTLSGRMTLTPRRVISVAEVLEEDDEQRIRSAFGRTVHQLYQCTEGFLAYTCSEGVLHLNEEYIHIEPEWIDAEQTRFMPIITDFSRTTQVFARYRLTDVLRVRSRPCLCGRVTRALTAIDGRVDDILWFCTKAGKRLMPLFPDALRHTIAISPLKVGDYQITQCGDMVQLAFGRDDASFELLTHHIDALIERQGLQPPTWRRAEFCIKPPEAKRRRIVCVEKPGVNRQLEHFPI